MEFILALAILATLNSLALAVEYKTLDNDYFRVEYPAEWNVDEQKGNTLFYYFVIPYKDKAGDDWSNYINVGLNGIQIRLIIDPQLKGMYTENGSINESIMHFLETFKVKKTLEL
ncbi:MAG: hypothetical protein LUQ38_07595 [Methanotrichaceae archaeon]|nr:hypothetical protein [Methanotrichaceae archaeon]